MIFVAQAKPAFNTIMVLYISSYVHFLLASEKDEYNITIILTP
jgi:hypothetical protein